MSEQEPGKYVNEEPHQDQAQETGQKIAAYLEEQGLILRIETILCHRGFPGLGSAPQAFRQIAKQFRKRTGSPFPPRTLRAKEAGDDHAKRGEQCHHEQADPESPL